MLEVEEAWTRQKTMLKGTLKQVPPNTTSSVWLWLINKSPNRCNSDQV